MPFVRFRTACYIVGGLQLLIGLGILAQGAANAMAPYGVPEATRALPHYRDAIAWVYVHTCVLGALMVVVGRYAEAPALKRAFARAVFGALLVYCALDFRSSEPVGIGLYEGPQSIVPALICVVMLALFAGPAFRGDPET
jgi:hypothetical protein